MRKKSVFLAIILLLIFSSGRGGKQNKSNVNDNGSLTNGGFIVADSDYYYYVKNFSKKTIYRKSKNGGVEEELLSTDWGISGMTLYNDNIFFCCNGLCKCGKDGSDFSRMIEEDLYGIIITDDWITFGNRYRIKTDGTEMSELGDMNGIYRYRIGQYDGNIYYSDSEDVSSLMMRPVDSSEGRPLLEGGVMLWTIDDGWIYYVNSNDPHIIKRMKTNGGNSQQVLNAKESNDLNRRHVTIYVNCFNVCNGWIYYVLNGDDIYLAKTDGSEMERISKSDAENLMVIDDSIFFRESDSGTRSCSIYRMGTDGEGLEEWAEGNLW